ncbi:hypothetical protein QJQ45_024287, partial [Haematococcus lacustris]
MGLGAVAAQGAVAEEWVGGQQEEGAREEGGAPAGDAGAAGSTPPPALGPCMVAASDATRGGGGQQQGIGSQGSGGCLKELAGVEGGGEGKDEDEEGREGEREGEEEGVGEAPGGSQVAAGEEGRGEGGPGLPPPPAAAALLTPVSGLHSEVAAGGQAVGPSPGPPTVTHPLPAPPVSCSPAASRPPTTCIPGAAATPGAAAAGDAGGKAAASLPAAPHSTGGEEGGAQPDRAPPLDTTTDSVVPAVEAYTDDGVVGGPGGSRGQGAQLLLPAVQPGDVGPGPEVQGEAGQQGGEGQGAAGAGPDGELLAGREERPGEGGGGEGEGLGEGLKAVAGLQGAEVLERGEAGAEVQGQQGSQGPGPGPGPGSGEAREAVPQQPGQQEAGVVRAADPAVDVDRLLDELLADEEADEEGDRLSDTLEFGSNAYPAGDLNILQLVYVLSKHAETHMDMITHRAEFDYLGTHPLSPACTAACQVLSTSIIMSAAHWNSRIALLALVVMALGAQSACAEALMGRRLLQSSSPSPSSSSALAQALATAVGDGGWCWPAQIVKYTMTSDVGAAATAIAQAAAQGGNALASALAVAAATGNTVALAQAMSMAVAQKGANATAIGQASGCCCTQQLIGIHCKMCVLTSAGFGGCHWCPRHCPLQPCRLTSAPAHFRSLVSPVLWMSVLPADTKPTALHLMQGGAASAPTSSPAPSGGGNAQSLAQAIASGDTSTIANSVATSYGGSVTAVSRANSQSFNEAANASAKAVSSAIAA